MVGEVGDDMPREMTEAEREHLRQWETCPVCGGLTPIIDRFNHWQYVRLHVLRRQGKGSAHGEA